VAPAIGKTGVPRAVVANARVDRGRDRDEEKASSKASGKGTTPNPAPKRK